MSKHHHQQHHQYQRFQPPTLFSICQGEVTRIEPYGCFVKLTPNNCTVPSSRTSSISISGLVHISQLYTSKVSHVSDIVSLNDTVWVKVIDVQVESISDEATTTGKTRSRHKLKLSMKYVNQDTGKDLDPENELFEEDRQRTLNSSSGGGSSSHRGGDNHDYGGANSLLGRALVSNIGMSTAIDPGNLILRGSTSRAMNGSTTAAAAVGSGSFNGYDLVGDDEGEPSLPQPQSLPTIYDVGKELSFSSSSLMANTVIPMGRGRGMTLPAWMTKIDATGDKLGLAGDSALPSNDCTDRTNDDNIEKSRRRRRDKRNLTERHYKHASSNRKTHSRHQERTDKDHHRRRQRRERSRSRSSSPSYSLKETHRLSQSTSSSSSTSYKSLPRSRSVERHSYRSRSHSHKRKKSHHKHYEKHFSSDRSSVRRRRDRRENRESPSPPSTHSRHHHQQQQQSIITSEFANVEEARAIVERLERHR